MKRKSVYKRNNLSQTRSPLQIFCQIDGTPRVDDGPQEDPKIKWTWLACCSISRALEVMGFSLLCSTLHTVQPLCSFCVHLPPFKSCYVPPGPECNKLSLIIDSLLSSPLRDMRYYLSLLFWQNKKMIPSLPPTCD